MYVCKVFPCFYALLPNLILGREYLKVKRDTLEKQNVMTLPFLLFFIFLQLGSIGKEILNGSEEFT